MFSKPILMKCGHFADEIVEVPLNSEIARVAACAYCFKPGTVNQAACCMVDKVEPLPAIKKDRTMPLIGLACCVLLVVALIVSL